MSPFLRMGGEMGNLYFCDFIDIRNINYLINRVCIYLNTIFSLLYIS